MHGINQPVCWIGADFWHDVYNINSQNMYCRDTLEALSPNMVSSPFKTELKGA